MAPRARTTVAGEWHREPDSRLILVLSGSQRYAWWDGQRAVERVSTPGEALWLAPGAPMRESWDTPVRFLGIVHRPRFLRFVIGISRGEGYQPGTSPWADHAPEPLGEPGSMLARARVLLRDEPSLDITTVATRCGFASSGYFAHVFRRVTGATPTAWRQASTT